MALGSRPELVGKRFVCVVRGGEEPPELGENGHIGRRSWRAGVIRAVSHRDSHNPELTVYVEFDDLEWDKREWVKVYEDFTAFFVEFQLVWAKRKDPSQSQGSKVKHVQWPALAFKALVGKGAYNSITAIEFLVEKHLEFATEDSAFQPYQDEVDSLNPVLRDNPQLHEEVKAWVKEHKVQEIFMQGPYSLNGYRVRVYRQDSATQWFTGIITHHDLFTRTMIVMNDQVLEPQNVDPSMVQMTFLDDVVYSLLKGENIGITSRRRSRLNQNSNTIHGHYTRAQANSPRPAMNSQTSTSKQNQHHRNARLNKRKGSDSSMPDEDRIKEERYDGTGRPENLKRNKHFHSKRRKPEEDEKKLILKRLRTDNISDYSESSDSENSNKRIIDSSSEQNSENELKCKNTSKINGDEGKSQSSEGAEEQTLIDRHSPWDKIQEDKKHQEAERMKSADVQLQEEKPQFLVSEQTALYEQNSNKPHLQDKVGDKNSTTEFLRTEQAIAKPPTPKTAIVLDSENSSEKVPQENSASQFSLQAPPQVDMQNADLKPSFGNVNFSDSKKQASEHGWNDIANNKAELALSGVLKLPQPTKEANDRDKIHHTPIMGSTSLTDEQKRLQKQSMDALKAKPHISDSSSKIKFNSSLDVVKSRSVHSPDTIKHKLNYHSSQGSGTVRHLSKLDCDTHRSSFHPVAARVSTIESTKSPLIIDKNEHFTVYRDPALVGPETAPNHMSPYLHQHNFALHPPAHRACLPPNSHHPALTANPHLLTSSANQTPMSAMNAHPLGSSSHHSVHHPHLLPTVLSGMPPASLLGGHPQLETAHASSLSHLALAHQQQQQILQHQPPHLLGQAHPPASYNQLGLYPIIWQYPNGSHAYSSLGLPSSKWVHPENHVNAEAAIRRNTASPWLHQPTPVTSADGLLMGHLPVRPSSADPHRPIKLATHSSPPLSKQTDHHKEDTEKKPFSEPLRTITTAPVKAEQEHSRTQPGKDSHVHRHYMDPLSHAKLQRPAQETGERNNKYKEEHRRILQENIDSSTFPVKLKSQEADREGYSRVTPVVSCSPQSHVVKQENNMERPITELYKMKSSVAQSLPQSNYFTTLSNSVANDPPRAFASKEPVNVYSEKQRASPSSSNSSTLNSYMSSLSKPPPLIKHQPEEVSTGKVNEQLPQQLTTHTITSFRGDSRSPTQLSISSSNALRSMPALHRAPVFHPPIHHSLDRKDASYSNLSPPTLTPVQPVNTGNKIQELQKPPTLVPEPKEASATYKKSSDRSVQESWKASDKQNSNKGGWVPEKNNVKAHAATASVIVRPPSSMKYDNMPVSQLLSKERVGERASAGINQSDCLKPLEARETGRIAQPIMNSDSTHVNFEKSSHAPTHSLPSSVAPGTNIMCSTKTDVTTSAPTTTSVSSCSGSEVTYLLSNSVSACTVIESTSSKALNQAAAQAQESRDTTILPINTVRGKTGVTIPPCAAYSTSSDFIHLKKHKAALAAAQLKCSNVSDTETNTMKNLTSQTSTSPDSNATSSSTNTTSSVGNGQVSQCSQPNYHTKLKKAWLTRHSEEDKNTNKTESAGGAIVSEMIKPCTVNLIASTSSELQNNLDLRTHDDKSPNQDRLTRRRVKRTYESGSESDDSDESESKSGQRLKRQPKPTYKKKQNDMQRRKGDTDKEEEIKPNGVLSRSAKEKTKLKLQSNSNSTGIPRSVLKDWRKVKKLKQTGESFLQDDSCCEIGPNLQKCRECRLIRTKKGEESTHSPVFCRFYYFRRLSFSKNGVVRIDGFSSPDQYDDEALSLWTHENYDDDDLDLDTIKYVLGYIGDKFCQLVTSEKAAMSWVKKDAKIAWKRAVRGVREMCDACEATLFNIHWVCQKCGFVVCLDCYKAKERKSSRDKELYTWMKCVKGQPHDYKHLMPTQIIPSSVLTDLLEAMHHLRDKFGIKSYCHCAIKQSSQSGKFPALNGVSQVLQNVLNHSNKISLCLPDSQPQGISQKPETNGNASPGSDSSTDSKLTSTESQSSLHWLADLAEQKSREEKKENKECPVGKHIKEERDQVISETVNCKTSPPTSQTNEQGSTLRDLLTTTAGKLRLGSTDAGIAFAPVYSAGTPSSKGGRSMPNILDDIIASVVENKIPATRAPKINVKTEPKEEMTESRKPSLEEGMRLHNEIPHSWICDRHILWLQDHKYSGNWKLFREYWKQGKTVLVSGTHTKININLWRSEAVSHDFGDHQGDLLNCKEGIVSSGNVNEFWDGFEDVAKRQKLKNGETVLLKLKDQPSGEDFKNMMPVRHEEFFKMLPVPEYCNPDGKFNLASYMPSFFVRPDLGPRMCSAYGVIATKDQDTGTTNLHIEVSDLVNILVYVGAAKGNGIVSKSGVVKKFEEEDLDECLRKRLKDSDEVPGSLWHIYETRDADKIREFLHKAAKEQCLEILPDHDPIRDQNWYLNKKLRQSLLEDYGVKSYTLVQFLGDAIILPAGAIYQVQNFHSCIHMTQDFVSPEHIVHSFHLTQELRLSKEEINYDDKLQVKNILYHSVKEMVKSLKIHEEEMEDMDEA
ncbi:probable JmjC domain-containing histone demethylation protein 2C isoform X2 [Spea bombifrons]|uniref:probable JmjC domain-containing histone demethylation protein 2C isoform X2 n=1 Tax=Spea bombifrons TaxID=233779 RepID=UPI002349CDA9|nr:probable JmjC domain-containing histone demethylation protein 2C isoform X2 [Spea bombifrons]